MATVTLGGVHELLGGLVAGVESRWRPGDGDDAFAAASVAAATDADLAAALPAAAAVAYSAAWDALPAVVAGENEYGQPSVTVWRTDAFHVEVIVWAAGAISVHDHVNAGAFVPLSGQRLHTRYDFRPGPAWGRTVLTGDLTVRSGEVLGSGDVRPILPGTATLHDLAFGAERCVTLSIRTNASGEASCAYHPPGLCVPNDAGRSRRAQALHHVAGGAPGALGTTLASMVDASADTAVLALVAMCGVLDPADLGRLVARMVSRWGGEADWWAALVSEAVRRRRLERLFLEAPEPSRMALGALRAGLDGQAAATLGLDRADLPDDAHATAARSRAALGWE